MSASDDGVWWESSRGPSWGAASWASFLTISCFFSPLNPPQGHELLEFAREVVATYLEDEDAVTRREAAVCCCHLVEHSSCVVQSATTTPHLVNTRSGRTTGVGSRRRRVLIEEILEKLLVAAVADSDVGVRKAVFVSLQQNRSFEEFLAQADSLRGIFIALSDEAFEVRKLAISMAGRLADHNPAYVLPALRRHLLQLLTDLKYSMDSKSREESAKLLGCLIEACERLMEPYIVPVLLVCTSFLSSLCCY
jgi:FKBP12-rapamycin complex-associated protein